MLKGYTNYYFFVTNYGELVSFVRWVLWFSLAKLLSAKYSTSIAKLVKKYGLDFKGKDKIGFFKSKYHNDPLRFNNKHPSHLISLNVLSKSIANLYNLVCSKCGSKHRVEKHHIRELKDLNPKLHPLDALMAGIKRKQIPLCRKCHMERHRKVS